MGKTVYVDFDGTLTTGESPPHWEEPLEENPNWKIIELVNNLYKAGHTIIIYTARQEEIRDETEYFLKKWDVMYHALRMEKPGYDLLIDDRAVSDQAALDGYGVDDLL
jgi:histidinol phosphatase-like enzyme